MKRSLGEGKRELIFVIYIFIKTGYNILFSITRLLGDGESISAKKQITKRANIKGRLCSVLLIKVVEELCKSS
jgi:hypothetical protein